MVFVVITPAFVLAKCQVAYNDGYARAQER